MGNQHVGEEEVQAEEESTEVWAELGEELKVLGSRLASTVRSVWESEENRKRLQELGSDLEEMVGEVSQAIEARAASAEAQEVRGDIERVAQSARAAGRGALEEARPQLLSALRRVNQELEGLAAKLQEQRSEGQGSGQAEKPPGSGEMGDV